MNILVLLTDLFDAVGGIQTFNRALVRVLDDMAGERGWTVTVVVLNDRGDSALRREYITCPRVGYIGCSRRRRPFVLATLAAARKADAVIFGHVHFAPLLFAVRLLRPSVRSYLAVYGIEVWKRLPVLRRLAASRMSRILSISRATASRMQEENGISPGRFSIFPCTLDPLYARNGAPTRSRGELGLPGGPMLLSVARLDSSERYKKIDLVIEAMPAVLEEVPDAFYVVVGDGSDRARLEDFARRTGVGERVLFVGHATADLLPSYYRACDLFVLPSLEEGFGIAFLEAMYCGKPCVGARAGGVEEVVDDGRSGLLAPPIDREALTRSVVGILKNESLRLSMGRAGRARLDRFFSLQAFRSRLESVLCS